MLKTEYFCLHPDLPKCILWHRIYYGNRWFVTLGELTSLSRVMNHYSGSQQVSPCALAWLFLLWLLCANNNYQTSKPYSLYFTSVVLDLFCLGTTWPFFGIPWVWYDCFVFGAVLAFVLTVVPQFNVSPRELQLRS